MNAVVTVCMGEFYERISKLTHPTQEAYAQKCKADFVVIREPKDFGDMNPSYQKLQIFDLFEKYDRILYLDTDIIVRADCPDLFTVIPRRYFAAFNEGQWVDRNDALLRLAHDMGRTLVNWGRRYYNAGVFMVSLEHRVLFEKPKQLIDNFYEQTYLNLQLNQLNAAFIQDLPYNFNHMALVTSEMGFRLNSFIVHYAGQDKHTMGKLITQDLEAWNGRATVSN